MKKENEEESYPGEKRDIRAIKEMMKQEIPLWKGIHIIENLKNEKRK